MKWNEFRSNVQAGLEVVVLRKWLHDWDEVIILIMGWRSTRQDKTTPSNITGNLLSNSGGMSAQSAGSCVPSVCEVIKVAVTCSPRGFTGLVFSFTGFFLIVPFPLSTALPACEWQVVCFPIDRWARALRAKCAPPSSTSSHMSLHTRHQLSMERPVAVSMQVRYLSRVLPKVCAGQVSRNQSKKQSKSIYLMVYFNTTYR